MAAKEHAAPYGGFQMDPRCVSSDANLARVTLRIQFSKMELAWYQEKYEQDCPESDEIILEIEKSGRATVPKRSRIAKNLLSWYSREHKASPGFFDYIDAHRIVAKKDLSVWNSSSLSDQQSKVSLGASGTQKFNLIKEYLASLVMKDAQEMLAAKRKGEDCNPDSLKEIREFFDRFFKPMRFVDVQIDCSPFKYIVRTPKGEIDIDDLSSGEKEILNTYIHFHQLKPENAVILFDEVDAHLHPDLERRYLLLFKEMSQSNQLLLTTHSPEIMIAAGSTSLYTLSKSQRAVGENQLSRVTNSESLHTSLSEIMGSNGMVSINRKVVFIEGTESSADRYIYEAFFPPTEYNISFIPAGDSSTNVRTSERVNSLLSSAGTFQEFYSIIDADIERPTTPRTPNRLFRLPVYHVENFLIDPTAIYEAANKVLLDDLRYSSIDDVEKCLIDLIKKDSHLLPFTKAIFDAAVAKKAKEAWDHVYKRDSEALTEMTFPVFKEIQGQAIVKLNKAIQDGTWHAVVKGRDLLKAFCAKHALNYEQFRNLLISELVDPPRGLRSIISHILGELDDRV